MFTITILYNNVKYIRFNCIDTRAHHRCIPKAVTHKIIFNLL